MGIFTSSNKGSDKPGTADAHEKDRRTDKEKGANMPAPDGEDPPVPAAPDQLEAVPPISEPRTPQNKATVADDSDKFLRDESIGSDERAIEAAARAAHEAVRAYSLASGEVGAAMSWTQALEGDKASARQGVKGIIDGNGAEATHDAWVQARTSEGWRHGERVDSAGKTHTSLVPYGQLTTEQRAKNQIFVTVARVVLDSLGISRAGR